MSASPDPWFWTPVPRPDAPLRLVCFPYAGGDAAVFRPWADLLAPVVELVAVRMPGRGFRANETPIDSFERMMTQLDTRFDLLAGKQLALFGHSMGALLAFESARRLEQRGAAVTHLFVSGRAAPSFRHPDILEVDFDSLDDASFLQVIDRIGGTPREVLEDPALRDIVLDYLRADFRVCASYRPPTSDTPTLQSPVTALFGTRDPYVGAREVEGWREYSEASVRLVPIEGDHFFVRSEAVQVAHVIIERLRPWLTLSGQLAGADDMTGRSSATHTR